MYLRKQQTMSGFSEYLDSFVETAENYAKDIYQGAVNAVSWVGDKARSEVKNFRSKKASLDAAYGKLMNSPPPSSAPAQQWAEYNEMMASMGKASSAAQTVDDQIRSLENVSGSLSGLGALPVVLVPATLVAGIVGATYLISKAMDVAQRYMERNSFIQARAGVGVPADQAMKEYDQANPAPSSSGGLFGDVSKLVWPLALVAGAMLFVGRR